MYIFERVSYFKRYCTFYTSKLFQLFSKNLIVIFGGQNWLIPYIVLCPVNPSSFSDNLSDNLKKNNLELFADLRIRV